ncbi:MAG: N-acetyltransferase [Pedobacter sp.]|nr:MAG: N-acetyltransferase [Pedobacter sp.]
MISPICFENDKFIIHSFRPEDLKRFEELSAQVFSILSDDHTLKYIPGKRLQSQEQAVFWLRTMVINFHAGRNFLHFITDKVSGNVVGMIDIISPALAKEHYQIPKYPFFIEFYLSSFATGCYLMTEMLPVVVNQLLDQGIGTLAAVVNRSNTPAKKVLKKARFAKKQRFDALQDLYEVA